MIAITPMAERPRERCLEAGAQSLSLRECLALILGSGPPKTGCLGLAHLLLTRVSSGLHNENVNRVSSEEVDRAFFTALEVSGKSYLSEIPGLGPAGQAKILAAFELGRRYSLFRTQNGVDANQRRKSSPSILPFPRGNIQRLTHLALQKISPRDRSEPQEWLGFVPVYRSGQVGQLCVVEKGARTHVNVDPAELFARVLALRPRSIFLFHNHPSGTLMASAEDVRLTEQVRALAQQLNIALLGHWIVTLEDQVEVV